MSVCVSVCVSIDVSIYVSLFVCVSDYRPYQRGSSTKLEVEFGEVFQAKKLDELSRRHLCRIGERRSSVKDSILT